MDVGVRSATVHFGKPRRQPLLRGNSQDEGRGRHAPSAEPPSGAIVTAPSGTGSAPCVGAVDVHRQAWDRPSWRGHVRPLSAGGRRCSLVRAWQPGLSAAVAIMVAGRIGPAQGCTAVAARRVASANGAPAPFSAMARARFRRGGRPAADPRASTSSGRRTDSPGSRWASQPSESRESAGNRPAPKWRGGFRQGGG